MGRRPVAIPADTWPPRMMAELAAGYCGEKHVDDFLERVGSVYPAPRVEDSRRRRFWYREDLDRSIGLSVAESDIRSRTRAKLQKMREERGG